MAEMDERHTDGPLSDREMPLMEHIGELRNRLVVVLIALGAVVLIVFPLYSSDILTIMWNDLISPDIAMYAYEPLELVIMRLKISVICALVIIVPLAVYEVFRFIGPGLYPHERKFFLLVVPSSLALLAVGAFLAYYAALPMILRYTVLYGEDVAVTALSIKRTFSIITTVLVGFGISLQFPLILLLAIKMGLIEYKTLKERRLWIYGGLLAATMFVAPDPTGFSQLLIVAVLVLLYELSMLIARFIV
ncbi:MAG: twin-arginine translocase subunit TatC [Halobacteriota archaeon]|nr:twin-arginine translocase subunit TatC [Halobacteriota archaeon]